MSALEAHDCVAALRTVEARVAAATAGAKRPAGSVTLIAVTKTFSADEIAPVLAAGHRVFGENRVQEAQGKWPALRQRYADIELHLIGPLQSNKARDAVALFDCIHTVDRSKIAKAIADEMTKQGRRLKLYVQVNTGEEEQKAGILPKEAKAFVAHCRDELRLPIAGLMCIPPVDDEPALHFAFLAKLARELGATHVRVGSAIFGSRG
jgi:pyridoxal phosphate enzyme (YggS family)